MGDRPRALFVQIPLFDFFVDVACENLAVRFVVIVCHPHLHVFIALISFVFVFLRTLRYRGQRTLRLRTSRRSLGATGSAPRPRPHLRRGVCAGKRADVGTCVPPCSEETQPPQSAPSARFVSQRPALSCYSSAQRSVAISAPSAQLLFQRLALSCYFSA